MALHLVEIREEMPLSDVTESQGRNLLTPACFSHADSAILGAGRILAASTSQRGGAGIGPVQRPLIKRSRGCRALCVFSWLSLSWAPSLPAPRKSKKKSFRSPSRCRSSRSIPANISDLITRPVRFAGRADFGRPLDAAPTDQISAVSASDATILRPIRPARHSVARTSLIAAHSSIPFGNRAQYGAPHKLDSHWRLSCGPLLSLPSLLSRLWLPAPRKPLKKSSSPSPSLSSRPIPANTSKHTAERPVLSGLAARPATAATRVKFSGGAGATPSLAAKAGSAMKGTAPC